jgi:trk system potassium uptake protein TrkH
MNYKMVRYTLGVILLFEALFLTVPILTALYFHEMKSFFASVITFLLCLGVAAPFVIKKPQSTDVFAKEGFVIVSLSWLILSVFGCLPFIFSGAIPSFIDAFFETVSGFTTTGSSIVPSVEDLPKAMLIWRSFTHWVGGMGVLVFVMAILPLSGAQNMHIMRAESPGPQVSKLVPRVKATASILYLIYIVLTLIMFVLLVFDPNVTIFEAINTALATAGTGGFGFRNDSLFSFSSYVQIVVSVFMLLFSLNFNSYYLILKKKIKEAFNTEIIVFLSLVLGGIIIITIDVLANNSLVSPSGEAMPTTFASTLKHVLFTVSSLVSSTGFATVDYQHWSALSHLVIVSLMFVGACAGSTGGGFKVSRIVILFKAMLREFGNLIHPNQVKKIAIDDKPLDDKAVSSVMTYLTTYVFIFFASTLLLTVDQALFNAAENTFLTNTTAVLACINNIGPGLEFVGPTQNFADFSFIGKLILSFDMLAGRLELFPMLILFNPSTWKK